jgi:hypothetical protein
MTVKYQRGIVNAFPMQDHLPKESKKQLPQCQKLLMWSPMLLKNAFLLSKLYRSQIENRQTTGITLH